MRVSTSESEATVLGREMADCSLWVGDELREMRFSILGSRSRVTVKWSMRGTGGLVR